MKLKRKRKLITYLNILDQPIRFNPFVFSRMFILWALLGLIGGLISVIYWIALEFLTHTMALFTGWLVIPVMAMSGLLAGIIIHLIGDPGEIQLIVNNIRFNKGKLDPRNNPSMILSSSVSRFYPGYLFQDSGSFCFWGVMLGLSRTIERTWRACQSGRTEPIDFMA